MKPQTLRTFIDVHTWVGLVAGFALFIAFYAGAITVFTHELHEWDAFEQWQREPDSLADADALVAATLAKHPEANQRFSIQLPGEHGPRAVVYWFKSLPNGSFETQQFRWSKGELEEGEDPSQLAELIYHLHYTAGIPKPWGTYAFGFICILYGVALVTGIIIYAPVFLKDLFAFRLGANLKRLWQDAHNVIGVLSLPFHIIFAWSGAVLCIGALLLAPFQFLVFDGKLMPLIEQDLDVVAPAPATHNAATMLSVADLLERARQAVPEFEPSTMAFTNAHDESAQVTIYGHVPVKAVTQLGGVALDANTGEVLRAVAPGNLTPGMTFLRGLTNLHFGDFGHMTLKWLYFILGMAGAFLFYSGNLLWVEARRNRRTQQQTRSSRVMAQLTLGVCLGSMAGISAAIVTSRLMPAEIETVYFVLFFGAIVWALLRAPIRAAYELLLACAVLTVAIPFINAITTGISPWTSIAKGHWVMVGVDAMALLFAWMFWRMARAVQRRGVSGDPNSVWALNSAPMQPTTPVPEAATRE